VGGTSTNIALVRGRRQRLAYVRVGEYATALRALDVWVAGAAGGSLARAKGRKLVDVGPRSAHIAGLRYASFATAAELADAKATLIAPRPGDPADHLVVDAAGGRYALTVTCAANVPGLVAPDEYAGGHREAARLPYAAAPTLLGAHRRLARQHVELAVAALARLVRAAVRAAGADLKRLDIVGVGGGSAALVQSLAAALGRPGTIARNAEILSSIGAATSLIQAVEERSAERAGPDVIASAIAAAEASAIAAGASPTMIDTTTEFDAGRGLVRAITTGSPPLQAGFDIAAEPLPSPPTWRHRAADDLGSRWPTGPARLDRPITASGRRGDRSQATDPRPWALLDSRGSVAHTGLA
jgi:N-methylhydantoinase A/oxoprolinase/acetone carboxylase beta subunit